MSYILQHSEMIFLICSLLPGYMYSTKLLAQFSNCRQTQSFFVANKFGRIEIHCINCLNVKVKPQKDEERFFRNLQEIREKIIIYVGAFRNVLQADENCLSSIASRAQQLFYLFVFCRSRSLFRNRLSETRNCTFAPVFFTKRQAINGVKSKKFITQAYILAKTVL